MCEIFLWIFLHTVNLNCWKSSASVSGSSCFTCSQRLKVGAFAVFSLTAILKWLVRKRAVAFAFYFKISNEIGTEMYALILFSVLTCHEVPQTNCRHASTLLGICCFLTNGFKIWRILKQDRISELSLWIWNVLYSCLLFPVRHKTDQGNSNF